MSDNCFAIYSAKVYTGLENNPWVEAVGVKDGRIAAIGSNQEVKDALPEAKDLGLSGTLVSPGLVDAHCHFAHSGYWMLMVDLRGVTSLAKCREIIKQAAKNLKPGQWLLGRAWNHTIWEEGREPNKADLDDIVPDNPAVMTRACGHSSWLNSKALEAIGIGADTPDPPGGKYDKGEDGEPTGMVREAMKIIRKNTPGLSLEEWKDAILAIQAKAVESGLTGVHTCESLNEWKAFKALEDEGKLKIRVHHLLQADDLDEAEAMGLKPGMGSDRLWVGHLKLFADGSLGAGTALLCEDYSDEPGCCGLPFLDSPELNEKVLKGYSLGYDVATHAIGDLAGQNAISAYAKGREKYPGDHRDQVEHVQLICAEDLDRYRDMDVTASVQPVFTSTDWHVATRRWGEERLNRAYIWKTMQEHGIRLQFGSDSPVEPIQPILGLQAAVLRQTPDLKPEGGWQPQERLSLEEALHGFTANAAYTARKEDVMGSLKPGNWADITVFEKDLSQTPPEEWSKVEAAATIIGGEVVFRK
jgi:predicted amidohydrolase YtcJ